MRRVRIPEDVEYQDPFTGVQRKVSFVDYITKVPGFALNNGNVWGKSLQGIRTTVRLENSLLTAKESWDLDEADWATLCQSIEEPAMPLVPAFGRATLVFADAVLSACVVS